MLFDIDGTLIDSKGSGGGALLQSLAAEFSIESPSPVALHGRTDFGIFTELLQSNGVEATTENLDRLCTAYFSRLPQELSQRPGRVLPGVPELLAELRKIESVELGLVTGNMQRSAKIKLGHYQLWDYFNFGVYGDTATIRTDLSEPALTAVNHHVAADLHPDNILIIGDTPMDIELAQHMGVRCLAVCTGGFDRATLESAGAHRVLDDLQNHSSLLEWSLQRSGDLA